MIVVRVKVSRGTVVLPDGDRQCGHYSQQPNGEIGMDKPHLLPNNPARYTYVPIEVENIPKEAVTES